MSTRMQHSIVIAADPGVVFDYVCTPAFWPDWHPSSLRLHGDAARPLRVDDRFEEDIRAGGREARLRWRVLAADAPRLWTAQAVASNGVELELTYRVHAATHGTLFERDLQYRVAGWWLNLLNVLVLRRRIAAESVHSLQQLKSVLEATQPSPPPVRSLPQGAQG
jgi:Polyketide cyclase / dehydrase and lipid transport